MAVTDLSHLCKGLTGGESMQATNTVSTGGTGAPGQVSEATAHVPVGDPTVDEGTARDYARRVR